MKKLLSSKWTFLFLGFVVGILVFTIYQYSIDNKLKNVYFKLKNDYLIEDIGHLKSGTLLKVDKGMSEGFTRYILLLNLNDGEEVEEYIPEEMDMAIPYWLIAKDTLITD